MGEKKKLLTNRKGYMTKTKNIGKPLFLKYAEEVFLTDECHTLSSAVKFDKELCTLYTSIDKETRS